MPRDQQRVVRIELERNGRRTGGRALSFVNSVKLLSKRALNLRVPLLVAEFLPAANRAGRGIARRLEP